MNFDHTARIQRLQNQMNEEEVDVVVLGAGADLSYFTGYDATPSERLTVLMIDRSGHPVLYVPELEAPRVEPGDFELVAWKETDDPVALVAARVDPARVAVGDHMWSVFLTRFQREWATAEWLPASELTGRLRIRKDDLEIASLRSAAHSVDRAMARIPAEVRFVGRTEADVARDIARLVIEEGHDTAEFTIVASGPNGASPHHDAGARLIREGDLVVCDFGGREGGYYSDSTRTFSVGNPSTEQVEVHRVVNAANEAARQAVSPGTPCERIDRMARTIIDDAGFGEYFIHRTGHGIGLEVHEHPYMIEGNEQALEEGMAFSVEPGVYLPDRFGVRIEDIVVCTRDGSESLNSSDRGLMVVD